MSSVECPTSTWARWWVGRRTGVDGVDRVGTAAPADHGYRGREDRHRQWTGPPTEAGQDVGTAVAMGPTVGGAWITVGTNGVVRGSGRLR